MNSHSPRRLASAALRPALLAAALWTFGGPLALAEAPRHLPIVEKAIAHHGGELYEHSETELKVCSRSGCFDVRAKVDGGTFDFTAAGKVGEEQRKVRITNDSVERWLNGEKVPVKPEEEQGLRDFVMARVYFPFLPYRLNDASVRQQDLGIEAWEGRRLHKVKVTFAADSSTDADDEYLYWFDPESGQLEQFAYSFHGNPGGLRLRVPYDDRRVGGILFSDQKNLGVEGEGLAVDQITPAFVAERMREISEVRLKDVEVRPLR